MQFDISVTYYEFLCSSTVLLSGGEPNSYLSANDGGKMRQVMGYSDQDLFGIVGFLCCVVCF